nr:hypothetical protein [uncultured Mediterranean phage uvMED]
MALSKITAASITDNTITNTQINSSAAIAKAKLASLDIVNADINASAAIAQSKVAALAAANMPAGSILQCVHYIKSGGDSYAATSSSGHDILNYTLTTKKANSTFYVAYHICHGVSGTDANMDSHDIHLFGLRTASSTHTYVGGNSNLTRNTAGAPTNAKLYCTDVPFSPSRGATYGNDFDTFHRSGSFVDSPSLAAGVTNQYRVRMYNASTMYINRGRNASYGLANAGGTSSLVIMEIAT